MLIFTLPSWYKTEKHPENCIFIYEQMLALQNEGHKVIVLSVQPCRIGRRISDRCVDDNGIITYYTYVSALTPSKLRGVFISSFKKGLERLFEKASAEHGKPDVFYAHFSFAAGAAALPLSEKTRIPLVIQEHYSGLMQERVDAALLRCLKKAVEGADGFLCVSEGLKRSIIEKTGFDGEITVISNMIHPGFVYCPPVPHDDFVFFSCGNLLERKRFDLLIEAFAEAFPEEPSVKLRIGGSGEERERLCSLINTKNMSGRISLIGQLSREDTLREYRSCDAFALASRAETYGLVYREALAVGRPVVSTRHGGFSADWDDCFGVLTDIDSKPQLVAALKHIYENYSDYNLGEISEKCLETCSQASVARQISRFLSGKSKLLKG